MNFPEKESVDSQIQAFVIKASAQCSLRIICILSNPLKNGAAAMTLKWIFN